jgi:hypothetical protein
MPNTSWRKNCSLSISIPTFVPSGPVDVRREMGGVGTPFAGYSVSSEFMIGKGKAVEITLIKIKREISRGWRRIDRPVHYEWESKVVDHEIYKWRIRRRYRILARDEFSHWWSVGVDGK